MSIEISDLHIEYPGQLVFDAVSLSVADHELVAIHSLVLDGGTSLLKGIAGFLSGVEGKSIFRGVDLLQSPPLDIYYGIGYVYEEQGLLSIYNVQQNICLPLQFHSRMKAAEMLREVEDICNFLGISLDLLPLKPHDLNDVQTRMVNLARALVARPGLLLIDELEGGMPEDYLTDTMNRLRQRQMQYPMAIIAATSSEVVLAQADRIFRIENHKLVAVDR